jgi:pseudouridine-5'-phosphate glycosidase
MTAASARAHASDEVATALSEGRPVVALETTLVSHGFSAGRGLAAALESERQVRAGGAVPATIGVLDGKIRVGLDQAGLERFAEVGAAVRKLGARDIAACVVQGATGSTTVGGTLAVCRIAGIAFLATGGIGGVHRGPALDISADLAQIASTPAVVVCSGAKALLDVPATSELLETLAVPVLGWRTPTLPLFYTAEGGPPVSAVVGDVTEAASVARAHWAVNPTGGLVLARPPGEISGEPGVAGTAQAAGPDLEQVIAQAVQQVEAEGVRGQAVTPAVLARIEELSEGWSVEVNAALIAGNATLAAQVAVAYAAGR